MGRAFLVVLALLLAGAGLLYYLFGQDIARARAPLVGRSHAIATTFGMVEYAARGEGEAVLGIHGSGGGFDQGLDMIGGFGEGYRLIAPSRFGYLGSDYPQNPTIAMQADAFAELLDELALDRVIVFGGSAGALSAMEFAIRHPARCRALVLLVPAAYSPTRKPDTGGTGETLTTVVLKTILGSDFIFWVGTRFFPDFMTRTVLATDPALVHAADAGEQARVRAILDHILPVSARARGLLFDMRTAGAPQPQAIDRIACPVLTMSSEDDLFGTAEPAKYIAGHVAKGRAVIFPTGGHVWVGHDEDVWREIRTFLGSIEGTTMASALPLRSVTGAPDMPPAMFLDGHSLEPVPPDGFIGEAQSGPLDEHGANDTQHL